MLLNLTAQPDAAVYSTQAAVSQAAMVFMATKFADAVFECPTCVAGPPLQEYSAVSTVVDGSVRESQSSKREEHYADIQSVHPRLSSEQHIKGSNAISDFIAPKASPYFNGTLWVANQSPNAARSPSPQYPYAFIDVAAPYLSGSLLGNAPNCPTNVDILTETATAGLLNQTLLAMQYLNLLTNSMYDPLLRSYPIQGGVSHYGYLNFDVTSMNESISFLITIFLVLMINGTWPLSIWRLSYERSQKIRMMMKSVGMTDTAYMVGMYLFDTLIMSLVGIAVTIALWQLKLSRFKDVPVAYLCTISVISAHSLSGLAQLIAVLGLRSALLTTVVASCVSITSSIAALLLTVILYRDENSWPVELSLIPFFAQV